MNPFESARFEADKLRAELRASGVDLTQPAFAVVKEACNHLDVSLKEVKAGFSLLKGADATINVERRWLYVRDDFEDEVKALLVGEPQPAT